MAFTFNGITKRITVTGVTEVDVKDLYSSWKNWVVTGDNLKYSQALRTIGGDPTVEGQTAPSYYFLTNGWRIVIDNINVVFSFNIYSDDGENPIITLNGATALVNNSDVGIVKTAVDQVVDYQGYIHVDIDGEAGTEYPIGTPARPVNNLGDACVLSGTFGIDDILIHSVTDTPFSMSGVSAPHTYHGKSRDVLLNVDDGSYAALHRSVFNNLTLSGDMKLAETESNICHIGDLSNAYGYFMQCGLEGHLHVGINEYVFLIDCYSNIAGNSSPCLDLNPNGPCQASVRRYSGGLLIKNLQDPSDIATVEYVAGKATLDETNTDGNISIRGAVKVTDNSNGTTVDLSVTVGQLVDISGLIVDTSGLTITVDETAIATAVDATLDPKLTIINDGIKKSSLLIPHNTNLD